ncbi:hypothetical protein B0H11DRAFT_1945611 [Mycena galericulata]|nr:hypothetical protein B0H11DRAFT_1945611 [Mycena galericulata]
MAPSVTSPRSGPLHSQGVASKSRTTVHASMRPIALGPSGYQPFVPPTFEIEMDDDLWSSFDGPPSQLPPPAPLAPASRDVEKRIPVVLPEPEMLEGVAESTEMACQTEVWETPMTEDKGCQTEDIPSSREVRDAACQTDVLQRPVAEVLQPVVEHADSASQTEELLKDNIIKKQARESVDPLSPPFTTQHAGTQPSLGNRINLLLLEAAVDAALQAILTQTATELAQQLNCPFPDMLDDVLTVCRLVGSVPRIPSSTDTHASQAATGSQATTSTIRASSTIPSLVPTTLGTTPPVPGAAPTVAVFTAPAHPQDYKTPPPPCMSPVRPANREKVKSEIVAALKWGLKDATGQDVILHWKDHERLIEFKHGWQIHGWPSKAMKQHPSNMGGGADAIRDLWDGLKFGTCYWTRVPDARMAELRARYAG